jgi:hypothetical protein
MWRKGVSDDPPRGLYRDGLSGGPRPRISPRPQASPAITTYGPGACTSVSRSGALECPSPLAPLAPHQPRPSRDAAHEMDRGGVGRGSRGVQESAGAQESDPARGLVQLARPEDVIAGSELIFTVLRFAPDDLEAWAKVIGPGVFSTRAEFSPARRPAERRRRSSPLARPPGGAALGDCRQRAAPAQYPRSPQLRLCILAVRACGSQIHCAGA